MAFKKAPKPTPVPETPDKLLLDLPRRKIPDVLPHQGEIMRSYAAKAANSSDVAMQLPTGSGKTLVALLIGEWLRLKNKERVVYLCPTNQLVNQVVEQADGKYGLTVLLFTGKVAEYDPTAKAQYRDADHIAITNYSSLFNTNPFFSDADVVILDDAHAAENYVAEFWSIHISRATHAPLHTAIRGILKPRIDPAIFARLCGNWNGTVASWADKLPTPTCAEIRNQLTEVLDIHSNDFDDVKYPWSVIRDHLSACQIYFSSQEILIRPLIPPTWSHEPFSRPRQRIYMSATLGEGGDLERLTGRRSIDRLPIPRGWDRLGVGRRFFIFPGMSLRSDQTADLRRRLMKTAGRSIVLVPSDKLRLEIAKDVQDTLKFPTFSAADIESSKKPFISESEAVAVVANRYDGIDFPGDECRLLFLEGMPKAVNLQERFLMSRMGANLLFNERIQTRILQASGRCTRSLEDFSAVVVSGEELPDYLADIRRRKFFHPELQAELAFGVEQSKGTSLDDLFENFEIFLNNGKQWEEVNQDIVAKRKTAVQEPFPAMVQLQSAVEHEIKFQEALWQGDYKLALSEAESVLGSLTSPELRGYRAIWHYLAGSAAWLGGLAGDPKLSEKARLQYGEAKAAAKGISWLVAISQYQQEEAQTTPDGSELMAQIERVEAELARLGIIHDRAFAEREKMILEGLTCKKKGPFEEAHKILGSMLGFDADNEESEGAPDPWWKAGDICIVFEDHQGADNDSILDVTKARQVATHPNWVRKNVDACSKAAIVPVLVTPATKVKGAALPHLRDVYIWPIDEFRKWAESALAVLRELRSSFLEPGDLGWRTNAAGRFKENALDAQGLINKLRQRAAKEQLQSVK